MLQIKNLIKTYREKNVLVQAVQGIDLTVQQGEFLVLLGSSGCGKTTTLRAIAGLERPDQGEISIDDIPVYSSDQHIYVPPEKRPIAMVFQSYAIWPHLTVYENVALPLRVGVRRLDRDQIDKRVKDVLGILGLERMTERGVTTLSGGQQQRVSLARAIAQQPKVLLMDEPLSNLDYKLRVRLRVELKDLMTRLGLTTIYVTHDQEEALAMGDRIAVLNRGEIVQLGKPRDIYENPQNEFVARFIGEMNFIPGVVSQVKQGFVDLHTAIGKVTARYVGPHVPVQEETRLLGIRPGDIKLLPGEMTDKANSVQGRIISSQFLGDFVNYNVKIGDTTLQVKSHHRSEEVEGANVSLSMSPETCIAIVPDGN